jgi:hypothetical protein
MDACAASGGNSLLIGFALVGAQLPDPVPTPLNLGCGQFPLPGFLNVDVADDVFGVMIAVHRLLKPDGRLEIGFIFRKPPG